MFNPIGRRAWFTTKKTLVKKLFALELVYQTKTFLIWHVQLGEGLPVLLTCTSANNPEFICMTYWKGRFKSIPEKSHLGNPDLIQSFSSPEMGLMPPCFLRKAKIHFTPAPLPWSSKQTKTQPSFQMLFIDSNFFLFLFFNR